ncbi:MAG: glycosyltransferase [Verrucomicrobia bacterium]|nr:glycosyltransferase [Verrucomicrobiota bacterium]
MNIVFANYGEAHNNSAGHIFGFAKGLAARGHDAVVAVAKPVADGEFAPRAGFRIVSHRALLKSGPGFQNGRRADVLHVWTPRENVRRFAMEFLGNWGSNALIIHLEDNEEAIFHRFTGSTIAQASTKAIEWPKGLIHPLHHREFMAAAAGFTLVHECLRTLVPQGAPAQEVVPVIDGDFFSPGVSDMALRASLDLHKNTQVIVYNGNDHAAAASDIRLLYDAVELLIERGRDVALVRTGHVLPTSYDGLQFRPGSRCVELGFIDLERVPAVMRLADVVVQPGDADTFNSYRLPAKVPEYLSMGKPLIAGAGNIGSELAKHACAIVLPHMTPHSIADTATWLFDHPVEAAAIGARGREFAQNRFSEIVVIPILEDYYAKLLWPRARSPMQAQTQ